MMAARSSRWASILARRSVEAHVAGVVALDDHDPHPGHRGARGVRAVRGGRDQADVAAGLAALAVVGPDRQQPGELPLRAGVGLQRDRVVAGDLGQPALEVVDDREVAGGLIQRRERVDAGELRPGDRLHLGGGVELHRAGPERDHRAVQGEVAVGEPAQVAHHRGLGVVRGEDRVGQEGRGPAKLGRDRQLDRAVRSAHAEGRADRRDVRLGRALVAADADGVRRRSDAG